MKKIMTIFGKILFAVFIFNCLGCALNNKDTETKETSVIKEAKIIYKEKCIRRGTKTDMKGILKNNGTSYYNGCFDQELQELIIKGSAKNITCVIKCKNDKVIYEKKNFDIDGSITITTKDGQKIDRLFYGSKIFINQNDSVLFSHTNINSGCM